MLYNKHKEVRDALVSKGPQYDSLIMLSSLLLLVRYLSLVGIHVSLGGYVSLVGYVGLVSHHIMLEMVYVIPGSRYNR